MDDNTNDSQYPLPAEFLQVSRSKVILTYKELHDILIIERQRVLRPIKEQLTGRIQDNALYHLLHQLFKENGLED